ncbi:MAG TPA: ABC transporter ATP-binding protein/permease, partial [Anaerolineae bacterium]|nr:ABC transporter ATP-binding protein/permease [Anaerolineae bacterium]
MTNIIELRNLQCRFKRGDNDVWALRGIDLTVAQGEFVALVGPSGSGKSTLLNLLGGLDRPSGGEIWVDGAPLQEADEKARTAHRRYHVGFIFQSFNLLPRLTALENVAIPLMLAGVGRVEREARAQAMLERVGLGHRLDHYPSEMSGGEQQRTAVARALIHNPALILADEPTGNLDSVTGDSIMSLLKQLNQEEGITLILVTHDEEVAGYADRIVKLRDGRIVEIVAQERPSPRPTPSPANQPVGKGRLSFGDIVRGALLNLRRRPVRNVLTAGGVLIGIVTLVAMVSFGVGVQIEVQRNFETVGLENVFVSPQFAEGDEFDPFAPPQAEQPITPDVVAQIEAIPEVTAVTPSLVLPRGLDLTLTIGDTAQPIRVSEGGESRFSFGDTHETMAGSRLADGQSSGVVLVAGLADKFLVEGETYDDLVGHPVTLTARLPRGETADFSTTIIGVRDSFGSRTIGLGLAEREAIKAWWFGQPDILQTEGYDMLMVRAVDLGAVTAVIEAIEEMDLRTQSLEAILDVANQVLALLQALLGSVGALALLVAALGVANTMMMAIYERTREIGILKALGASRGEIRSMFTEESAMLGLLGGVFGLF